MATQLERFFEGTGVEVEEDDRKNGYFALIRDEYHLVIQANEGPKGARFIVLLEKRPE